MAVWWTILTRTWRRRRRRDLMNGAVPALCDLRVTRVARPDAPRV
jgi:hypothetical protein